MTLDDFPQSLTRSQPSCGTSPRLGTLAAKGFPVLLNVTRPAIFLRQFDTTKERRMATHRVRVREDLLQKLTTLSEETGKPISDLIEEVLDWARYQSQARASAEHPAEAA